MSSSRMTRDSSTEAPRSSGPATGTRVDPAHERANDATPPRENPPGAADAIAPGTIDAIAQVRVDSGQTTAVPAADALQQIQLQASQLAAYLQRQATSVDHRESELNARLAAMENQVRAARLWIGEQQPALEQRQAELDARENDLERREARLSGSNSTAGAPPSIDEAELAEREAELERREAELDALAERLKTQLAAAGDVEQSRRALRATEARVKDLDSAEQLLAGEQAEHRRLRKALTAERAEFAEEQHAQWHRAQQQDQRRTAEHEKIRRDLKRQADELAARQAVLEQMRADMSRSQQEVLEIRLATEELWSRLCGSMAPAALTRSLAQIRVQLADQHRLVRGELSQQKLEVQALTAQLSDQHRKLAARQEDLQAWADQRQKDLEQQATQLAQQQRRLADEQAESTASREAWDSERFRLNQEIRRLLRRRDGETTAAA